MKRIGIEPGKSFDFDKLDPAVKKALESVPAGSPAAHDVEGARRSPESRTDGR